MILYLQVFLTYTIQLYTYQRVFRDQKLNMKFFLTDGSSPTVHCCYGGIENDFDFFGPNWSLRHENLEKLIKTVA